MPTPLLSIPEIQENQSGKYITHNESLAILEGIVTRVLSRTNGGPPTPSEGDTYIVDSATGNWSGATVGDIAHYYSGAWHFITPVEGLSIRCVDEAAKIYFDGSGWSIESTSAVTLNVTLADQSGAGIVDKGTVDANATGFGAALYVTGDGHFEEAAATGQATMPCMALALDTGTGADKNVLFWGRARNDAWAFTPGAYIYVNTTTGGLTETQPSGSGEIVQVVGVATASNTVFFNPSYVTIQLS